MDGKRKINREITLIEGREQNQHMAQDLVRAGARAGIKVNLVKSIDATKIAENKLSEVFSDMVLWRGPVGYAHNFEIDRAIAWINKNVPVHLNTTVAGGRTNTSNKFFQHGLFFLDPVVKEHILPIFSATSKENIEHLIDQKILNYPFVLKPDLGTRGEGIVLVENKSDLDKFGGNYMAYSAQPYVKSKYDWRVFVLGGVALGSMRKIGDETNERDFMAKSGGKVREGETDIDILEEIYDLAVRAAAVSGLQYAGIDLIRDDKSGKFYILETNIAGGWQNGFYKATGVLVPDKIMEWFNDRAMIFESSTHDAVKTYVEKRLAQLSRENQKDYQEIVSRQRKIERKRDICNFDLDTNEIPLVRRLSSAYALMQNGGISSEEIAKIKMLISSIEKYEISNFGNFIGRESGSLDESIIRTAYYLAIHDGLKGK